MEKVIPNGLNYADIKPEAIENQVKLVRFTPTANIQSAQANDTVRFQMSGNGFYDPYSAYIKIGVEIDQTAWPTLPLNTADTAQVQGVLLDRSAHSFISRFLIRSNGTELERIDQYDVVAAMINDVIYSNEQAQAHKFEGFGSNQVDITGSSGTDLSFSTLSTLGAGNWDEMYGNQNIAGPGPQITTLCSTGLGGANAGLAWSNFEDQIFTQRNRIGAPMSWGMNRGRGTIEAGQLAPNGGVAPPDTSLVLGGRYDRKTGDPQMFTTQSPGEVPINGVNDEMFSDPTQSSGISLNRSKHYMEFTIPLYSGIMGVLMPDKKLLPLSLLPLEVEFMLNPHAFIAFGTSADVTPTRNYRVTKFELFAHMLFFEQEVHRSLEAVVAEHGIFINFNTFYLGPITVNTAGAENSLAQYSQINVHFKSINSVHWVYLYAGYETDSTQRKLHFVSHDVDSVQIRNGTDMIPSEPIRGSTAHPDQGLANQFMIETLKAWNKMHQPALDTIISPSNFTYDFINRTSPTTKENNVAIQNPDYVNQIRAVWGRVTRSEVTTGRCQYGISMEGEELGQDKSTITGRQGMIPFDIMVSGRKTQAAPSYLFPFCRCDFILYVRPDLVVSVLGK